MRHWEVIVGNLGVVYSGDSGAVANEHFNEYRVLSQQKGSRVSGEHVVLLADRDIRKEYTPEPSGKRKISMSLASNTRKVVREMTYDQYEYMSTLAKELNQNADFTVPYFYVSDWEEQ